MKSTKLTIALVICVNLIILSIGNSSSSSQAAITPNYSINAIKGWEKSSAPILPPLRFHNWGQSTYDSESDRIIIFGGEDTLNMGTYYDDTWAYDCNSDTWENLTTSQMKNRGKAISCFAYDSESDRLIMFGGTDDNYFSSSSGPGETWSYDYNTNNWTEMTPTISPSARGGHSMSYDKANDKIIMYGGFTDNMYLNNETFYQDTWSYDYNTNNWTEMIPSTMPPPLGVHESAYDSESGKTILFGGKSFASGDYSRLTNHQTWVYDYSENSWVNMTTDLHPSRRAIGMMAYNSRIDRICFYGGYDGITIFDDTWYYDFNENLWELIDTTTSPGSRFHHTLDYDSESDNVVLFGGRTQLGLLVFSDETWVFHSPINIPDSPVNLQAILIENNYVELSWTPPITTTNPPISNYTIYRGTESGELNVLYGTLDLSFIDTTVIDGQTYYYTLRALNALGEGDATDEISIEIPLITTTSSTPGFTILLLSLYLTILITLRRNKRA